MKNTTERNNNSSVTPTDAATLLEKYKKQVEDADVHSYSETFHHEYYDYSDSNCCC